mmetsp:Transcript_27528/g.46078  ORF Transcript_27528/g.46078 Transcript_27528/m.46078 type:complete len:233 (+) Transcript_27528:446-1144(+)|eukprot:CAMPEP_0198206448 /NCGR_PEP_ID=MMETSP1445-20131203/9994_1 /TAXON_ID=36898 /ORGANISM="Pyramimonas sp., Strain CCMP2087" /LENGTH=232 /DNA_ID=CAMNT_0043879149 /DNA_START=443 /DNA_END=1141 /DNA_ORIENTATION=+
MVEKKLSYHDVLLRSEDIDLLRGPHWLNDQVIAFYFEYLTREKYRSAPDGPVFVNGATSFLLANSSAADVEETVAALQLAERPLILFAVNNNPWVDVAEGGSHWSLLVSWKNRMCHCDSAGGTNRAAAQQLALKLAPHLSAHGATPMLEARTPQQVNGYDCGMHLLANAQAVALHTSSPESTPSTPESTPCDGECGWGGIDREVEAAVASVSAASVSKLRDEIYELILSLME